MSTDPKISHRGLKELSAMLDNQPGFGGKLQEALDILQSVQADFDARPDERRVLELQRDAFEEGMEALEGQLLEISYHPQSTGVFNRYEAELSELIDREARKLAKPVPKKLSEYSASERSLLSSILIEDSHSFEPDDVIPLEVVYSWLTECWNCATESYVWLQPSSLVVGLKLPEDPEDVIKRSLRLVYSDFDFRAAFDGPVETKEGGSYFGFSCPSCDAVLGLHYLKREASARIIAGTMMKAYLA